MSKRKETARSETAKMIGTFVLGLVLAGVSFFIFSPAARPAAPVAPTEVPPTSQAGTGDVPPEIAELVAQMVGGDNAAALAAVDQLRAGEWLLDGSLARLDLGGAQLAGADLHLAYLYAVNLNGADLNGADLQGVRLADASLHDADLRGVVLNENTVFQGADMQGANLSGLDMRVIALGMDFGARPANLAGANLSGADLRGVNVREVNLAGADLSAAKLEGANLTDALFDETTILPDGSNWSPQTDMARFTDPGHPEFFALQ
jgi:hypothetical protein